MRLFCSVVLAMVTLTACGRSAYEHLQEARADLATTAYPEAIQAAEVGLRRDPSTVTSWGLELVKLEAHARGGDGEETKTQLTKLADLYPQRIPVTQYAATAHQLNSAGQGAAAIEVLDMGMQRYPGDPTLERLIGTAGAADVDSAELEMLRTLGYIE
jgi:predicted Zn-dependent protease